MCLLHFRLTVDREVDVPVWVVLGRSYGLCWRSWAALGAYVGGLGPLLEPKLAVLAALGASEGGLGTGSGRKAAQTRKSGPNPSGNKVPKGSGWEAPNAGKPGTLGSSEGPDLPEGPVRIFSVDMRVLLSMSAVRLDVAVLGE